jgi:hypothetical protein
VLRLNMKDEGVGQIPGKTLVSKLILANGTTRISLPGNVDA